MFMNGLHVDDCRSEERRPGLASRHLIELDHAMKRPYVRRAARKSDLDPSDLIGAGWIGVVSGRCADGSMIRAARAERLSAGSRRRPLARLASSILDEIRVEPRGDHSAEAATHVTAALDHLTARQSEVIRIRYGLDGEFPHTLKEMSGRLGVTPSTIRCVEQAALRRLRWALQPLAASARGIDLAASIGLGGDRAGRKQLGGPRDAGARQA